ncbi:class I SAM-dependent methyltransferase [Jannaschia pohangensis]|uniref:Methyltransferase domain-containing protein n=1 Tax=Jannaschia pohangensis TaxID=390807 RepID=A0A1I3Q2U6_9RHOB|nr:class I SAM-dependent methyltransferase [Jannaschia pohangensis]SFJ28213.1 Methyltransferase domain-containing protein [Jannaschia pohangensis]
MASFDDMTTNRFRRARGRMLATKLAAARALLGRKVVVFDVGGRPDYWANVKTDDVEEVVLLNNDPAELERDLPEGDLSFRAELGDARDLSDRSDGSVDFIHSNSVIEHVGPWEDMAAMASELRRVGAAGWVQTPAWEFPIEPHFRAPFLHWFAQPLRRKMMWLSPHYRKHDIGSRRAHVDRINLLSRGEVEALFPDCALFVERIVLPKSYVAHWLPDVATNASPEIVT